MPACTEPMKSSTKPCARRWILVAMMAMHALCLAKEAAAFVPVSEGCNIHDPHFPELYARIAALRNSEPTERQHLVVLAVKDKEANLNVEATLHEIDLNGDGTCDLVVTTRDPLDTGGDSEVLSTIYIAQRGGWLRIGARSAVKANYPSELDIAKFPDDENFAFSGYVSMRDQKTGKPYLVTWHVDRIVNGFEGYRILEVDMGAGTLRDVGKWSPPGIEIYKIFKTLKAESGKGMIFEPSVEATELRRICKQLAGATAALSTACREFTR